MSGHQSWRGERHETSTGLIRRDDENMNAIGMGLKEKESANNELQNGMIMDMIDRTADKRHQIRQE